MARTQPASAAQRRDGVTGTRRRAGAPKGQGTAAAQGHTLPLDWRWIMAGAGVLLIAIIIAVTLSSRGGAEVATSGAAPVGQVTESSTNGPAAAALLPVGTPAPDLKWTLSGQPGSLAALRGHPVLLEFFATWCPHCQRETPILTTLAQRYAARGLLTFGISANPLGQDQRTPISIADIQSFATRYGAHFPLLLDANLVGAQRYGVHSYPTLYLIDQNGVIRFASEGETPETTLAEQIDRVLAG